MSNGLSDTGFDIQTLAENIDEYETALQTAWSLPSFTIEDNEYIGQLAKVIASRETKCWQAMQQIYQIWTRSGAEGVYLDEMFALNGIFREAATAGSGNAVVQVSNTADSTTVVASGTTFTGSNGISYATSKDITISENLTALRIKGSGMALDTYTIKVVDGDGNTYSTSIILSATDDSSRLTFLNTLATFLTTVNSSDTVYVDTTNLVLYWGFDASYSLSGLSSSVTYTTSPQLGNMYGLIECVATTTGYNSLPVGGISSMTPLPTGYVSVTNLTAFSSGTDKETDAAFIERASESTDSPASSTRSAVIAGLLKNVADIETAIVQKTVSNGIVTVTPIIVGGTTEAIAEELYRTQPINNVYSGTESYDVSTEDGETETIKFSRGTVTDLIVKVVYQTSDGTSLSDDEEADAITNLTALSDGWSLGQLIFNYSLMYAVASAVDGSTITSLLVYIGESSDALSTDNYQAGSTVLPELLSANITFTRTTE